MNKVYVFIYDTSNIVDNPILPDTILNHCNQYKITEKRNISLSNYHRLGLKLDELFGININNLYFENKGKPVISGINISMSHSSRYYGFAISIDPIGFDIEELIEEKRFDLSQKILTQSELDEFIYSNDKSLFLTTKWCLKEAYGKLKGTGINKEALRLETNDYYSNRINNSVFVITPNYDNVQIYYNGVLMR